MNDTEHALEAAETAFNAAMVSNDSVRVRACITESWCLGTPERGPGPKAVILPAIADGVPGDECGGGGSSRW